MENRLTDEEVLRVASLSRLSLDEKEVEKYSYQLKSLLDEINKIGDAKIENEEGLIAPYTNDCMLFEDVPVSCNYTKKIIENAPNKFDNFVEVAGVFDE